MLDRVFQPGRIGSLSLPHRIIMGAMHLGYERDGEALAAFYAERVRGGAALILTGGSAVSRAGAAGRRYTFINEPADSGPLAKAVEAVHRAGGWIALQLLHAGRYASEEAFGLRPLAPSAVPSRFARMPPREMSSGEIAQTIADFASGAGRARELGFDGIELMGSEGYLLNQFCSPVTNQRQDQWGGDAQRRMRFPLAVVRAVREAVRRDLPLIYRLSMDDLMPGSSSPEEIALLARALVQAGADAIDMGVGWHESSVPTVQHTVAPGAWVGHAARLKQAIGRTPVIAGTRIPTLELAEQVLVAGQADFVALARPFLADPAIIVKSHQGRRVRVNPCIACNQACIDRSLLDEPVSCMVNPRAGRELPWREQRSARACRFAVVGGGPAGLEAARVLATRGHEVVLYEATDRLGGQFQLARRIPGKAEFGGTIDYFEAELKGLGVEVRLQQPMAGPAAIETLAAYAGVIIATGVRPRAVDLPRQAGVSILPYDEALLAQARIADTVAIIGAGGIGVDAARRLSAQGSGVTLMCRGARAGQHIGRSTRWVVLGALREQGVRILTGVSYELIAAEGVWVRDREGARQLVAAERIVIAAGQERNDELSSQLQQRGCLCRVVGGARDAAQVDAVRAFREGAEAAHELASVCAPAGAAHGGEVVDSGRPP